MPYKNSFDGDSGGTDTPIEKYGDTPDKWGKVYGDQPWREINDARYLHKLTDYDKHPHKRYRSESDESTEMPLLKKPRYRSEEIQNRAIKRRRSESGSDLSDDPPLPKRYKKRHIWRKKTKTNV